MTKNTSNPIWQARSTHGRDHLIGNPQALWKAACEYFQWCDNTPLQKQEMMKTGPLSGELVSMPYPRPYTVEGFCNYCHLTTSDMRNLRLRSTPEMQQTIETIEATIRQQKIEGAAAGFFSSATVARELGIKDTNTPTAGGLHITVANEDEKQVLENL